MVSSKILEDDALKIYDFDGYRNISGDRIHQARILKQLSQSDLAARMQTMGIDIGREAISRIETGDRFVTDYELMAFAEVLGVSIDWLIEPNKEKWLVFLSR